MYVKRGQIYMAKPPKDATGSVIKGKYRPVVVVSNNTGNYHSTVCEVVYLTTAKSVQQPTHVEIFGDVRSTALCEQVTTLSQSDLFQYKGKCTKAEMEAIEQALMISLGIHPATESEADEQAAVFEDELEQCKEELNFYKQQYDRLYNAVLSGIEKKRRVGEICD